MSEVTTSAEIEISIPMIEATTIEIVSDMVSGEEVIIVTTVAPLLVDGEETTPTSSEDMMVDDLSDITIQVPEANDFKTTTEESIDIETTVSQEDALDSQKTTTPVFMKDVKTEEPKTDIDTTTNNEPDEYDMDGVSQTTVSSNDNGNNSKETTTPDEYADHDFNKDVETEDSKVALETTTETGTNEENNEEISTSTVALNDSGNHEFDCKQSSRASVNLDPNTQIPLECIHREEQRRVLIVIPKSIVDSSRLFASNVKVVVKDLMVMDISPK